jgi:hypothetical protein
MVASTSEMDSVMQQVKAWPVASRIALARRVLETLNTEPEALAPGVYNGPSSDQVLGLWSQSSVDRRAN